jgi:hypothetical protein
MTAMGHILTSMPSFQCMFACKIIARAMLEMDWISLSVIPF